MATKEEKVALLHKLSMKTFDIDNVKYFHAGIYAIENTLNGKMYIGRTRCLIERWLCHNANLRNNKHENRHLQRAFNKYGADKFMFNVIEYVDELNTLHLREGYWMYYYKTEYGNDKLYKVGDLVYLYFTIEDSIVLRGNHEK